MVERRMELPGPEHREDVLPPRSGDPDDKDLVIREAVRAEERIAQHRGEGEDSREDHPGAERPLLSPEPVGMGDRRSVLRRWVDLARGAHAVNFGPQDDL